MSSHNDDHAEETLLNHEAMNNPLDYAAQLIVEAVDREKAGALVMTPGGDYELAEGSCWIRVGNLSVYVKKEEEGVAVDIFPLNDENSDYIAGTHCLYADAERDEAEDEGA